MSGKIFLGLDSDSGHKMGIAHIAGVSDDGNRVQVPAVTVGDEGMVEQTLEPGIYNVQVTLPSGLVLQRTVDIEDQKEVQMKLGASRRGKRDPEFSLQEYVRGLDVSDILEQAQSYTLTNAPLTGGVDAFTMGSAGSGRSRSKRRSRTRSAPRPNRARVKLTDLPDMGEGLALWKQLAQPPERLWKDGKTQRATRHDGETSIWQIPRGAGRQWAALIVPGGRRELASIPLPWNDVRTMESLSAELLVDPARKGRAASSLAIADSALFGLLAFLDHGRGASAAPLLKGLDDDGIIENTIYEKGNNPLAACAAAYVGLSYYAPAERERWDHWLQNCMTRFEHIPDTAIVHARRVMLRPLSSDERAQLPEFLLKACRAGVPYFSAGVHLLREMLTLCSGENGELDEYRAAVERVAARTDYSQVFTVLRYRTRDLSK